MPNLLIRIIIAWLYAIALPIYALGQSKDCVLSKQLDNQCASYCYKAMKPLLEMASQCQQKDAKLVDLVEQLGELKQQLSVYKERESKNKELLEMAANVVAIKEKLSNMEVKFQKQLEQQTTETVLRTEPNSCLSSGRSFQIQKIKVAGMEAFSVPCNNELVGHGWTLIQQRLNGSRNFYRGWDEYREGFGDFNDEFFIGLEKLHHMLASQPHQLYIRMENWKRQFSYANYDNFGVGAESSDYKLLSLGKYSGDTTDAMRRNEGMKFSTYDRDNDMYNTESCAQILKDGWWHAACSDCNLNGIYNDAKYCIYWNVRNMISNLDCLKTVQIFIKPKAN
ncbi:fibrinogen-like protein A [Drosophila innubila]|uniref:fibrinogen-like protein A n=1 Tax=Drosophila innubila TaxID=198719 RepID=UPI00148D3DDA|nr:fibrinogen-like protein A [Drosophila innubila]